MKNSDNLNDINQEELDLKILYKIIYRNKNLIIFITFISFIFSCLVGLSKKKIWQGQFEIVLSKSKASGEQTQNVLLGALQDFNISGIVSDQAQTLNTEVGILESPSVLMPVFEYVKQTKSQDLIFSSWKNSNLFIKLRKKTAILNISYEDDQKDLIIPVLTKISSEYQNYSGKRAKRNNEIAKDYLKGQIKIFKDRSNASRRKAITYAIDNDLSLADLEGALASVGSSNLGVLLPQIGNSSSNRYEQYLNNIDFPLNTGSNTRNDSIENIRVNAANEIKNIEFQIEKIENLNEVEDLQYLGSTVPSLLNLGLPQILEGIETELVELRARYTPNDISIRRLEEKRDLYAKLIKERSIGYLKARKLAAQALMESVERPKGTLITGKELMREAKRDEKTLVELENKLRTVELAAARQEDPWQLITKPTLQSIPVAPNKTRIALIGTLIGFFIGFSIAFFKEKRSQLVFEEEELEAFLGVPIFKRLIYSDSEILESPNELQFKEMIQEPKSKLVFYLSSELASKYLKVFQNYFSESSFPEKNIELLTSNLSNLGSNDSLFILTSLGKIDSQEIKNLKKRFQFNKVNLRGIILINSL